MAPFFSRDFKILERLLGSILILGAIFVTGVPKVSFIVNKTKTVAMASTTSPAAVQQAVYTVNQGVNNTPYSITIDGTTTTFTSSNTNDVLEPFFSTIKALGKSQSTLIIFISKP